MDHTNSAFLVEMLRRSPLLTATQQGELVQRLQPGSPDARSLARQLLERGWLTSFQVNQLFQGRGTDLVVGPYVLLERLGEGGTGRVFKARHLHMNRIVALKVIRPELLTDPEVVARFRREVQVASQMTHPNVVHAYDAGPAGPTYFLVTEFVEGTDLERLVRKGGPLSVDQTIDYLRQAALGLQHIHEHGLVHRDIKPSNMLVTKAQGSQARGIIKILDLGLARLPRPTEGEVTGNLTGPVVTMGTLDYLAPEQAIDFGNVDSRADIYSLGCAFYFALTGQPPFPAGTVAQKLMAHQQAQPLGLNNIPAGTAGVLRRMMAKRPEDRFQTPLEVVGALPAPTATLLPAVLPAGMILAAKPTRGLALLSGPRQWLPRRLPQVLQRQGSRRKWLLAGLGGFAALTLLVALFVFGSSSEPKEVFLNDLPDIKHKVNGATKLGRNGQLGFEDRRIVLNGVPSPKGLGMHPPDRDAATISFRLDRRFQTLTTTAGLNDSSTHSDSPLVFVVVGDGRVLWQSKPIQKKGDQQEAQVRVRGVDILELMVTCTGGAGGGHAVWIEPRLTR